MKKYTVVKVSGIAMQIAKKTDVLGYTVGVLEAFLPSDEETVEWSDEQTKQWISENNNRMEKLCAYMNDHNL